MYSKTTFDWLKTLVASLKWRQVLTVPVGKALVQNDHQSVMSLEHRTRRHGGVLTRAAATAAKTKLRKPSTREQRARWNRKYRAKNRKPKRKKELSLLQQRRRVLRKKRRRSALGLGVDYELPQDKLESAAIETLEMSATPSQTMKPCACVQCALLCRAHSPFAYRCPVFRCRTDFSDFVSLFEHQLDVHGLIYPHCRRLVAEMYHQERGVVPYPPATVYIGEQFFYPSVRPMAWTLLERVETERQTLMDKLTKVAASRAVRIVWKSFQVAYARIQQGGIRELQLQYRMALEYYNSSLTFPIANRSFQDGSASVAYGRNWLTSSEREDAALLNPLDVDLSDDEDEADLEFVLIDSERDQSPGVACEGTAASAVVFPYSTFKTLNDDVDSEPATSEDRHLDDMTDEIRANIAPRDIFNDLE